MAAVEPRFFISFTVTPKATHNGREIVWRRHIVLIPSLAMGWHIVLN